MQTRLVIGFAALVGFGAIVWLGATASPAKAEAPQASHVDAAFDPSGDARQVAEPAEEACAGMPRPAGAGAGGRRVQLQRWLGPQALAQCAPGRGCNGAGVQAACVERATRDARRFLRRHKQHVHAGDDPFAG